MIAIVTVESTTGLFVEEMGMGQVIFIPVIVFLIYLTIWGEASVFTVAKRMNGKGAGRNRTSFKAVSDQSRKFIGPIVLTEIVRLLRTVLLSLGVIIPVVFAEHLHLYAAFILIGIFLLPGLIYQIRTIFYAPIMITKGKVAYGTSCLKESIKLVKGNTWAVVWRIAVIAICLLGPLVLLDELYIRFVSEMNLLLDIIIETIFLGISSIVGVLFGVCIFALFTELNGTT